MVAKTYALAADEAMIEYAVRKHFPDLPDSTGPRDYARNYLEKLIQVPFRIPALGETETRIYVTLLLAGVELGDNDGDYANLAGQDGVADHIGADRDRLAKPMAYLPAAIRKGAQTFGQIDQANRQADRRRRAETLHIGLYGDQVFPSLLGPDYSPHFGGGSGLSVPQDRSHRFSQGVLRRLVRKGRQARVRPLTADYR